MEKIVHKIEVEKNKDSEYSAVVEGNDVAELIALVVVGVKAVSRMTQKSRNPLSALAIVNIMAAALKSEAELGV